jgi:glycine/D-amino acid oxidase-like deaminating enzyme
MHPPSVLVVGSGVVGAATALSLAEAGARVTVVDRGPLGGGTSSRCDGNVLVIDKDPGYQAEMALLSQDILHDWAPSLGDIEYRRPGSYLALGGEEEEDPARAWVAEQREAGLDFRYLDRDETHRAMPDLAPDVPGSVYSPTDSTLNPLAYVAGMLAKSRRLGAVTRPHTAVEGLATEGGRVIGARVAGGDLLVADVTVVAAGVWTPELLAPLDVRVPIRPRRGHLIVSAKGPRFGDVKVMEFGYLMAKFGRARVAPPEVDRFGVALVYEPTLSGNFVLGSSREFAGFDTTPDPAVLAAIVKRALRFYPGMASATVLRGFAGLRPWTPDHLPVVSRVTNLPGLVVAAGHEGDGVGLAAVTGRLVRAIALGEDPPLDIAPLSLDRFSGEESP